MRCVRAPRALSDARVAEALDGDVRLPHAEPAHEPEHRGCWNDERERHGHDDDEEEPP